ncbi:MAG: hypothetical protein KGL16_13000, partial [Acidobacteriota bacterium]|nr:hypothetical protein [Acidobacteriota bacterium]
MSGPAAAAAVPLAGAETAPPSRRPRSPRALARLVPWLRPHRRALVIASVCLLGSAAIGLAFPAVVKTLLDAAFQQHDRSMLDRIALLLVALFAVQGVLNFVQVFLLSSTAERVIAKLREQVFTHLVHLSPGFFSDQRSGDLTSRLSADLAVLQSVLNNQVAEIARQVLFLIGGL